MNYNTELVVGIYYMCNVINYVHHVNDVNSTSMNSSIMHVLSSKNKE